ncbi:hypothetical protein TRFO_28829 [Tritrichomonas foetus]|uniref:AIR9-like A9 domain-containing protein n=1 Tax=Tritrichomonas foetus TaxID=1144522 RepID=A0A1J4JX18_9EUKA|nr:hypothetical protein TRFO_28829 [Tritrichomonas foetus]|eukprot:OHT03695.1 hypothetical protein TRFO_28829 [Tritrichomonas foetus]
MNKSKIQRSPLSPRLRPPKSPQLQVKVDKVTSTYLCLAGKNLKTLSPNLPSFSPARHPGSLPVSSPNILYLDLHDNQLPATALKCVNPNIFVLNLTNNPLLSCAFPSFPKLRTLTLDNCGLTNFEGFPFLPKLTYLSAVNNQITSFKGLTILPALEHFDLSGNPTKFNPYMVIAAVGSINMRSIDKVDIDVETMRSAFKLSPLVGYSLRCGRSPEVIGTPEEEVAKSQEFLTAGFAKYIQTQKIDNSIMTLTIEPMKDGHAIVLPYKATKIKWYKSRAPNDKGVEWFPIPDPKIQTVLPVTMNIRLHLVRVDFTLDNNKTYSLFTDDIVGRDKKDLALPYPIDPVIAGTPIEGSLMSLLPMPFPARIAWVRDSVTIIQDVHSIMLTKDEIGKSVACLLQPYCPLNNTLTFGTIFTASETVAPLLPIVTGITFPDSIMEGQKLEFKRFMNPDREGESQITLERAVSQYGEWILITELKKDNLTYTPTSFDVNNYLRIGYTPVTTENTTGATVYFYSSSKIIPTMPTFYNPAIGGIPKTFFPLVALADYSGGQRGKCSYDWYFSKRPIDSKKGPSKRLQKVAHNSQYFTPTAHMADGYLACQMVPVRADEVVGDPVFIALDSPILLDDAPKPLDGCPTEAIVGKTLKFPIVVEMYLSKPTGFCGFDLLKTGQTYTPREKHVGRILRIVTENNDIMIGEIRPATPVILDVSISADKWVPGQLVSLAIKHKHLMPDKVEIVWLRCSPEFEKPIAMDNPEYTIQPKDIGYSLRAIVTPMDHTGKRLESKSSPNSPNIKVNDFINPRIIGELMEDQELTVDCSADVSSIRWYRVEGTKLTKISTDMCVNLTAKEVGHLVRAKITLSGSGMVLNATTSGPILAAEPTVTIALPPKIVEGDTIEPEVHYRGGTEGQSIIRWYRETDDGWEFVKEGLKYKTTLTDVDSVLRLVYIPIRIDRERGEQFVIEAGPVDALTPSVSKVRMIQNSVGNIECVGEYRGGYEGQSFIIWRVYEEDGTTKSLGKTVEKEMPPNEHILGKKVDAVYVPIRSDGLAGNPVIASNQIIPQPLPTVTSADILVKGGVLQTGALMRCRTTCSPGAKPKFQWHRGDGKAWEIIEGATNIEYTTTKDDIGFLILCSVIAVDNKGWPSPAFAAATQTPIVKRKNVLAIQEPLNQDGKLVTGAMLSTNLELDQLSGAKLKWQKIVDGEWKTIASDDTYLLSVNDVGERLRVFSAKTGQASEPTKVVELEPIVASYVRAIVKSGQMKVKARAKIGVVIWTIIIEGNIMTLRSKNGSQKSSKLSIVSCDAIQGSPDEMILYLDPSSKFALIPDLSDDKRLESLIKKENARDFVVAAIREFINKK